MVGVLAGLCGLAGLAVGSFLKVVIRRSCPPGSALRYPLVELACAALMAGAAVRFGESWTLPAFEVLVAGLLALACTDVQYFLLPKRMVYPLLGLVGALLLGAAGASGQWGRLAIAVACALAWFGVLLAVNLYDPRLLAFGDVRLALVIGLGLGWLGAGYAVVGFFLANLLGALVGLALMATKRIGRRSRLPYGAFLALGSYVTIFAGAGILGRLPGS